MTNIRLSLDSKLTAFWMIMLFLVFICFVHYNLKQQIANSVELLLQNGYSKHFQTSENTSRPQYNTIRLRPQNSFFVVTKELKIYLSVSIHINQTPKSDKHEVHCCISEKRINRLFAVVLQTTTLV